MPRPNLLLDPSDFSRILLLAGAVGVGGGGGGGGLGLLPLQQLLAGLGDEQEDDEAAQDEGEDHRPALPEHGDQDQGGDLEGKGGGRAGL